MALVLTTMMTKACRSTSKGNKTKQRVKMWFSVSGLHMYCFLCFMACWCTVSGIGDGVPSSSIIDSKELWRTSTRGSNDERSEMEIISNTINLKSNGISSITELGNGNDSLANPEVKDGRNKATTIKHGNNIVSSEVMVREDSRWTSKNDDNETSVTPSHKNKNEALIAFHKEHSMQVVPTKAHGSSPNYKKTGNNSSQSPLPSTTTAPSQLSSTAPPSTSPTYTPSSSPTVAPTTGNNTDNKSPKPAPHKILMRVVTWIFFVGLLIFCGYECYLHRSTILFITTRLCDEMLFRIKSFCNRMLGRSASSSPSNENRQPATLNEILFEEDSQSLNQAELSERLLI